MPGSPESYYHAETMRPQSLQDQVLDYYFDQVNRTRYRTSGILPLTAVEDADSIGAVFHRSNAIDLRHGVRQGGLGTPNRPNLDVREDRISLFSNTKLSLGLPERATLDKLKNKGFTSDTGLADILEVLHKKGINTQMRGGDLFAQVGDNTVSIPLFSASLGSGGARTPGAGEYMFKGGSAFSVTAQVGTIGTRADEMPLLKNVKTFSQHFYEQLLLGIQNSSPGDLKNNINKILQAQETFFPGMENMVETRATDAVGYVDPLQYAGRQKLGRHHLGHSQQILLEITDENLIELVQKERKEYERFATGQIGKTGDVASLKVAHGKARDSVLDHLKRIEGENPNSQEAKMAKRLNLAMASQSGEWIFHDNKNVVNRNRRESLFLKMTSAEVRNLSILPGQDIYEKGRQFQLSRAVMKISSVDQLPAAVADIMGFTSIDDRTSGSTIKALSQDVKALSGIEQNVALGRRTIGAQFLDSRLNLALFGDSGVMMSAGLMTDLDIDPTSGFSRHTVTSKINLKAIKAADGSLDFRGILRADLAKAIFEHREQLDKTGTIKFKPGAEIALQAHEKMFAPGFNIDPTGKVVVGEKTKSGPSVMLSDMRHANDVLRDVQSRGMDPREVAITGVRLNQSSQQLELVLAQQGVVTADSGYIFGGHRVSVGQALDTNAVAALSGQLKIKGADTSKLGLVFGDLGLSPQLGKKTPKTSFGFNTTLLSNLAEVISDQALTTDNKNVKALVDSMGGKAVTLQLQEGGKRRIQFQGLGSKFDRISDREFGQQFKTLLNKLDQDVVTRFQQETFAEVDIREVLKISPGFGDEVLAAAARSQKETQHLLRSLGLNPVSAKLQDPGAQKFMTTVIKSIGGDIAVREEEPMAKFGTKATKISAREAMIISESMDFARKGGLNAQQTMNMRSQLFKDLVESHPNLFQKGGDISLMLQMLGDKPVFEEGDAVKRIRQSFDGKDIGTIATLLDNQGKTVSASGKKAVSIGEAKNLAKDFEGKLPEGEFKNTLLGMIKKSADGVDIAQVSDKAIIVQGPKGPMLIPSPKTMGFAKEEGFLRIPGSSSNFDDLEKRLFENLAKGRAGVKEAQSMYLNVLQDVEEIESARLRGEQLDGLVETLSNKQDRLMRVLATNLLSKQGLLYNSTINPDKVGMAARLRLQHSPAVGLFEIGLTEKGLVNTFVGSRLQEGKELFGASSIEEILEKARAGKLYTHAYREPIAGGRQMMALKVKLLDESNLRGSASNIDFSASAFLHSSMVKYGMEGDFDKDSVNLFRLASMSDEGIEAIHKGQVAELEGVLGFLKESRRGLLGEGLGDSNFKTQDDVLKLLAKLRGGTTEAFKSGTLADFTIGALGDIVEPKHATPIIEAHFAGRSYVDHMMSNVMELQADADGKNIVRQNFIARVGEEKAIELDQFLTKANSLFIDESGGRFSTYNYTDARNITKYMFLKKVAHGGDRSVASSILQNLMLSGREFAHSTDDNFRQTFIDDLVSAGEVKNARARQLTDALAEDLLRAAGTFDEDRRLVSNIGQIDPQTGSILQQLAGQSEASAVNHAKLLARRMVFSGAMAEMFKDTPGMMPGEGIAKNLSTVIGRLFKGQNIDPTEFDPYATAAQQISDIQGMQGDQAAVDVINQENMDARSEAIRARRNSMARRMMEDAADAAELGTSKPGTVPNSSYKNALISGEFFAKISQMKYFKPAAAVVGGLAGIEVIRSAVDRFSPGNVPATGYNSANTMPPPPMISSPQDPTFARDAIPNTNIARVAKHHGQRSSVNISGKMDRPVDFRGITNNISLNNGYVPNIQGSFRSSLSDTMSQAEMAQFVGDRMGSSF